MPIGIAHGDTSDMTQSIPIRSGNLSLHRRRVERPDGRYALLYGYAPPDQPQRPEAPSEVAKGGELRFHPLRGEWNLYAPHRQNRTYKPSAADDPLAPSRPG
ncbi:MAG: hypothetical protein WBF53_12715, partial [Litorimonas sp.]